MDIGIVRVHERCLETDSKDRLIIEDTEMCTYSLYEVIDTVVHPTPEKAEKYAEESYTFDALTGCMRIYRLVGTDEATDEGITRLLEGAAKV